MAAYYNEFDPYAAQWLRNLIAAGHIAQGEVDERSITEVSADELRGFTQCHFFAGIGGWSYALRIAGWDDARPVWTGSCPCQPFSAAGKGKGFDDKRHLWPEFHRLISKCRPPVVFGEQVASADVVGKAAKSRGRQKVRHSLSNAAQSARLGAPRRAPGDTEGDFLRSMGSPRGAAGKDRRGQVRGDGTAAEPHGWQDMGQSVSRSHRPSERLRLLECAGSLSWREQRDGGLGRAEAGRDGESYLGHAEAEIERLLASFGGTAEGEGQRPWLDAVFHDLERIGYAAGAHVLPACGVGSPHIRQRLWFVGERLADTDDARLQGRPIGWDGSDKRAVGAGGVAGFWSNPEWLPCRDGKARPAQPGIFPLAHGVSARVGRLRAYGNAIVPQAAQAFIEAVMQART